MTIVETINAKGQVTPSFIDLKTGKRVPWGERHNTLSFDASKSIAHAFGGDESCIPNRIGIIYGNSGSTEFPTSIVRQQNWDDLVNELNDKHADVQIQPFSYSPSFAKTYRSGGGSTSSSSNSSSDEANYPGWAVTFHAHSDSVTPGELSKNSGSSIDSSTIFSVGSRIFQAILLNQSSEKYTILARVSLDHSSQYYTKPENFEVALDWTVKFF